MKTLIFVNPERIKKFESDCSIPEDMKIEFSAPGESDTAILEKHSDTDFIFADVIREIGG